MKQVNLRPILFAWYCLFLSSGIFAQSFPCDNGSRIYFFHDTGGPNGSLSYFSNYTAGSPSITVMFPMPSQMHNGLAGNPVDNYLYYLEMNKLMRLTSSGTVTQVCTLPSSSIYGCFDYKGRYWTISNGDLCAYDISSGTLVKGPFNVSLASGFLDIAFNPKDCHFYVGALRIDTNGVADPAYAGTQFVPAGTYGGIAIGSDGNIYGTAGNGSAGDLSQIDLTSNSSSLVFSFTPGPVFAKSDMASFPCAQVTAAFKDSLSGCSSLTGYFSDQSTGPVGFWSWNFGDAASGTNNTSQLQNASHTFSAAGTYTVTLTVSTGSKMCYATAVDSAFLVVNVSASGLSVLASVNNAACNGYCDGGASVSVLNGTAPYSFLWNTGSTDGTIGALCAGNYSVSVTDAAGCKTDQAITITEPLPLNLQFSGNTTVCAGSSATLTAMGGTSYQWSTGETSSSIVVVPLSAGSYSVTAWVNGCPAETSIPVTIKNLQLDLGSETDLCGKDEIQLTADHSAGNTYQWSTGETGNSITVSSPGTYWLTVYNSTCKASDSVVVAGDPSGQSSLFIPNAFTPNNDGLNDVFSASGNSISEFHMMIFNRWGELIFKSDEINSGWDGNVKNAGVQQDVYVVKLRYKTYCTGDSFIEKVCHVSVLN